MSRPPIKAMEAIKNYCEKTQCRNRAYLCDGYGCDEKCAEKSKEEWEKHNCHHTLNEEHARNKCRRDRKWSLCADGKMIEKEE